MKPVTGGYLYRLPSPWLVGRTRHFLLTEDQKERLRAALADRHPARTIVITIAVVSLLAIVTGAVMLAFAALTDPGYKGSGIPAGIVATVVLFALLYAVAVLTSRTMIRRVRSVVPDLAQTDQHLTDEDLRVALDAAMSPGLRLFLAMLLALACLAGSAALALEIQGAGKLTSGVALRGAVAILFGAQAIVHLRRWMRDRRG